MATVWWADLILTNDFTGWSHSTGWKLYLHACLCTLHQSASTGNHTQVLGHPPLCQWTQGCPGSPETRWHPRSSLLFLTAPWNLLIPVTHCKNIRSENLGRFSLICVSFVFLPGSPWWTTAAPQGSLSRTLSLLSTGETGLWKIAKKNVTWRCWGSRKQLSFADLCNDYLYFIF